MVRLLTLIRLGVITEIEVPGDVIKNGLYVEVEGVIQTATSVFAEEIEYENEDFDDDIDKISLEGVVAGFTDIALDFFVGSQRVNASTAQFSPAGFNSREWSQDRGRRADYWRYINCRRGRERVKAIPRLPGMLFRKLHSSSYSG